MTEEQLERLRTIKKTIAGQNHTISDAMDWLTDTINKLDKLIKEEENQQ